jgi:hypothetical protein
MLCVENYLKKVFDAKSAKFSKAQGLKIMVNLYLNPRKRFASKTGEKG